MSPSLKAAGSHVRRSISMSTRKRMSEPGRRKHALLVSSRFTRTFSCAYACVVRVNQPVLYTESYGMVHLPFLFSISASLLNELIFFFFARRSSINCWLISWKTSRTCKHLFQGLHLFKSNSQKLGHLLKLLCRVYRWAPQYSKTTSHSGTKKKY